MHRVIVLFHVPAGARALGMASGLPSLPMCLRQFYRGRSLESGNGRLGVESPRASGRRKDVGLRSASNRCTEIMDN